MADRQWLRNSRRWNPKSLAFPFNQSRRRDAELSDRKEKLFKLIRVQERIHGCR